MDFADIAEEDDGSEEFEITAIMLYDHCACMLCGRIRFFYLIDYATPHVVTKWGGSYLKDENVLTHAGFCLGRLLTFVNTFAMDGNRLNAQKARQERLFAPLVATPVPTPVPSPVVEVEVETTAVVSMDEEDTNEQQQHHHQTLAIAPAAVPAFKPMVICPEIQRAIDAIQTQLQEKMRNLPPLPDSLFGNPINQQNSVPPMALRDVMAIADPLQQPCSSNSLPPNLRDCIRKAYKLIAPELLERTRAELKRPGTASSISSCGSSSSTVSSPARRSDREKRKLEMIRHVGQKCDPNCQTCDQLLK